MTNYSKIRDAVETYALWDDDARDFHSGYAKAILWANLFDEGRGEAYEGDLTFDDLYPLLDVEAWGVTVSDCDSFLTTTGLDDDPRDHDSVHEIIGGLDYGQGASHWSTYELAGHDFALTRSGHGVGFWDRGLGDMGDRLTALALSYGWVGLSIDADYTVVTL